MGGKGACVCAPGYHAFLVLFNRVQLQLSQHQQQKHAPYLHSSVCGSPTPLPMSLPCCCRCAIVRLQTVALAAAGFAAAVAISVVTAAATAAAQAGSAAAAGTPSVGAWLAAVPSWQAGAAAAVAAVLLVAHQLLGQLKDRFIFMDYIHAAIP